MRFKAAFVVLVAGLAAIAAGVTASPASAHACSSGFYATHPGIVKTLLNRTPYRTKTTLQQLFRLPTRFTHTVALPSPRRSDSNRQEAPMARCESSCAPLLPPTSTHSHGRPGRGQAQRTYAPTSTCFSRAATSTGSAPTVWNSQRRTTAARACSRRPRRGERSRPSPVCSRLACAYGPNASLSLSTFDADISGRESAV